MLHVQDSSKIDKPSINAWTLLPCKLAGAVEVRGGVRLGKQNSDWEMYLQSLRGTRYLCWGHGARREASNLSFKSFDQAGSGLSIVRHVFISLLTPVARAWHLHVSTYLMMEFRRKGMLLTMFQTALKWVRM